MSAHLKMLWEDSFSICYFMKKNNGEEMEENNQNMRNNLMRYFNTHCDALHRFSHRRM